MMTKSFPYLIYKYLILNGSVSLPGFGNLEIVRIHARNDFAQRTYYPPEYVFKFRNTSGSITSSFIKFLEKNNFGFDEVEENLKKFAKELKAHIQYEGKLDWAGIGTFSKLSEELYVFQEKIRSINLYSPVKYEHVIRENVQHTVLVGDIEQSNVQMEEYFESQKKNKGLSRWERGFIYLFVLASMALLYRFSKGNFSLFQPRIEKIAPAQPSKNYINN